MVDPGVSVKGIGAIEHQNHPSFIRALRMVPNLLHLLDAKHDPNGIFFFVEFC
tara:strand:+ start:1247 stop:1405 length:159 start_codon:yes stop_codon:yes gene_type:complete